MDGVVSIIKPSGISSHDVVSWARKKYGTRKIGHAGTLDPGAAGVLVLGIGKGTKLIPYIQEQHKTYRAEIALGFTTDSLDMFSSITKRCDVPKKTELEWKIILDSFLGVSYQIPPMTSALKVNGKPLYELARKGITIEREPRKINIFRCELINYDLDNQKLLVDVECSSGTYIRTLCNDIALKANTLGCMTYLIRTRVGSFNISTSMLMSDNEPVLLPMVEAVSHFRKIVCKAELFTDIKNGKQIEVQESISEKRIAMIDENGNLIALANRVKNTKYYHPYRVFI